MGTHLIYLLTCQVNGKIYVGRTGQTMEKRWQNHIDSIDAPKTRHLRLYRAMKKYKPESFEIEIIESGLSFEESKVREEYHIMKRKSYVESIGYNMSIDTRNGLELLDEDSIRRRSSSNHSTQASKRRAKHGIGIRLTNGRYIANISYNRTQYNLCFSTREEAAIAYDHLALWFHGPRAVLNYPQNQYSKAEIETTYQKAQDIINQPFSSQYRGVSKNGNKFRATVFVDKRVHMLGDYKDEKDAALAADKARLNLKGNKIIPKLNFPDRITEHDRIDIHPW